MGTVKNRQNILILVVSSVTEWENYMMMNDVLSGAPTIEEVLEVLTPKLRKKQINKRRRRYYASHKKQMRKHRKKYYVTHKKQIAERRRNTLRQ